MYPKEVVELEVRLPQRAWPSAPKAQSLLTSHAAAFSLDLALLSKHCSRTHKHTFSMRLAAYRCIPIQRNLKSGGCNILPAHVLLVKQRAGATSVSDNMLYLPDRFELGVGVPVQQPHCDQLRTMSDRVTTSGRSQHGRLWHCMREPGCLAGAVGPDKSG
jgi:hypothetical protein